MSWRRWGRKNKKLRSCWRNKKRRVRIWPMMLFWRRRKSIRGRNRNRISRGSWWKRWWGSWRWWRRRIVSWIRGWTSWHSWMGICSGRPRHWSWAIAQSRGLIPRRQTGSPPSQRRKLILGIHYLRRRRELPNRQIRRSGLIFSNV